MKAVISRVGDAHFDAAIVDFGHGAGDDSALADATLLASASCVRPTRCFAGRQLLDAERDAFLFDVDVEHLGRNHVAAVVVFEGLFARLLPVEIGEVNHAVHIAVEADEQAEFGLVLDFAFDGRADRELLGEGFPRVCQGLLEAERDAALVGIDLEHHDFDFLGGRDDLAGVDVLLGPAHFGDVDQAFDARLQFNERTVVGDVGDAAGELGFDRVLGFDAIPRIGLKLLHAERDTVALVVDADDLDLDGLADRRALRIGWLTRRHAMSVTCSRPSMPPRSTNAP